MKLIFGTKNSAKIDQLRMALKTLDIEIQGLPANQVFPEIEESGQTALENARQKALTYARLIGQPVLSMDNALYFNDLASDRQPGVNVRRIKDGISRLSDEEVITFYSEFIRKLGHQINGYWEYGICLAYPDGRTEETIIKSPRIFVSQSSPKRIDNYPFESLQIDPDSGRYISEMTLEEQKDFWQKAIGRDLCDFIKRAKIIS